MNYKYEQLIYDIMPFTTSLIGSTLDERAKNTISKILTGKDIASQDEINLATSSLSPNKIEEIKKEDLHYKYKLLEIIPDLNNEARIHPSEKIPAILSTILFLSTILLSTFFVTLFVFIIFPSTLPVKSASKDALEILIGSIVIWCGQAINFYFGTTHRAKNPHLFSKKQ